MSYYFSKTVQADNMETIESRTTEVLKAQGFGIVEEIDFQKILKNKLDIDHKPYKVLGACNPPFANEALNADRHIGALLPCNVTIQQTEDGFEVSAIDPVQMMKESESDAVKEIAEEIQGKLKTALEAL
jgi:uncharacterized protein (DUF302 family)